MLHGLQKKRGRRRSKPKYSVASTDAVVESTTNELVYNQPSSEIVETSEALIQVKTRSASIEESIHSASIVAGPVEGIPAASPVDDASDVVMPDATPSVNGTYMNHVIDEKATDIDNNNEKIIDHGNDQEGLFIFQLILAQSLKLSMHVNQHSIHCFFRCVKFQIYPVNNM